MQGGPRDTAPPTVTTGRTRTRRRMVRSVAWLALAACSLGLLCVGVFAAWVRSEGTYISLGAHGDYSTDRYALSTTSTDWRTTLFGWAGSVRLEVAPRDDQPLFVGVAPPDVIARYLEGVAYTTVSARPGSGVAITDHPGTAPTAPAGAAAAWTAHAEGVGTQTLRWSAADGPQTAVALNADGTRLVRVRIESVAVTLDRMPWWLPAGAIALGSLGLVSGAFVIRRTRGPARR